MGRTRTRVGVKVGGACIGGCVRRRRDGKMAANMKVSTICSAPHGLLCKRSCTLRSPCCILTSGALARGESELVRYSVPQS